MVTTEGATPAPLKLDRPRTVERSDGITTVDRHFQDGSTRTTTYDQRGEVKIVTNRTNPSTGAVQTTTEYPNGWREVTVKMPDGTSTLTLTSPQGEVERTEFFTDAQGQPARTTHYPDGRVEKQFTVKEENGFREVVDRGDGTSVVTTYREDTRENGDVVSAMVIEDSNGKINSRVTVTHPDGSQEITLREGFLPSDLDRPPVQVVETIHVTKLPDGATRERVSRPDGSVETTVTREYTNAEGAQIREVLGENQVQIITGRQDGSWSNVTKYDDGTYESRDSTPMQDGSTVFTRTNRDKSWETVQHHAAKPGEVARTTTTRSDGTRIEQALDNERMHTVVHRPDGTRSETRLDMDGFGSTGEYDSSGRMTTVTTHEGEAALTPFPTLGDQAESPAPPPVGRDDTGPADQAGTEEAPGGPDAVLPDVFGQERPAEEIDRPALEVPLEAEPDPVLGGTLERIEGRGVALEPEVASRVEDDLPRLAGVTPSPTPSYATAGDGLPAPEPVGLDGDPAMATEGLLEPSLATSAPADEPEPVVESPLPAEEDPTADTSSAQN